jgi:hypothetical protein
MICTVWRIAWGAPTEVPPNFITRVRPFCSGFNVLDLASALIRLLLIAVLLRSNKTAPRLLRGAAIQHNQSDPRSAAAAPHPHGGGSQSTHNAAAPLFRDHGRNYISLATTRQDRDRSKAGKSVVKWM